MVHESASHNKINELKRVYERCIETRNFEIQQLLSRNNFLIVFQAALFTGFFQSEEKMNFLFFIFGGILSLFQIGVASGAKFWQEYWEAKLSQIENKLKDALGETHEFIYLFSVDPDNGDHDRDARELVRQRLDKTAKSTLIKDLILSKYSVSTIPIYIGLTCLSLWLGLTIFYYLVPYKNFISCVM